MGMQAVVIETRRKASCDAGIWMNLLIIALPVLLVIALAALGIWLVTTGGRTRG
jgi:hypothetical protein